MADFSWAVNKIKLARAVASLTPNATEEDVKAKYVSLGGLVVEQGETVEEVVAKKIEEVKLEVIKKQTKERQTKSKKK